MLDRQKIASRIKEILGEKIIKIYHVKDEFFLFDSESVIFCAEINIQVDLIGPFPRQVTSEITSLPGLLTPFQADLLINAPENVFVYDGYKQLSPNEREENEASQDKVYQKIEKEVTKIHMKIAQGYGQTIDIDAEMKKFPHVPKERRRWRVNFLSDATKNDPSSRIQNPKSIDLDSAKSACHARLWTSGHFVTSGLKYGCDWLAYKGSPSIYHASYMVSVINIDRPMRANEIASLSRIATKNRKRLLLLSVQNQEIKEPWRVSSSEITWERRTN